MHKNAYHLDSIKGFYFACLSVHLTNVGRSM